MARCSTDDGYSTGALNNGYAQGLWPRPGRGPVERKGGRYYGRWFTANKEEVAAADSGWPYTGDASAGRAQGTEPVGIRACYDRVGQVCTPKRPRRLGRFGRAEGRGFEYDPTTGRGMRG